MKILCVASEVEPFAKTGGLADVAGALPKALAALGHDVRVVLPLYRQVDRQRWGFRETAIRLAVTLGPAVVEGRVWETSLPQSTVRVYGIEQAAFFDRDGLYTVRGVDHPDNLQRFSFFSQAALQIPLALAWRPEIVHCHDWQAALACAHLALGPAARASIFSSTATVFTVHNLAYQGVFPRDHWDATGLPEAAFALQGLEFYGHVNCLKGGLITAGLITTVSPTYAREIQTSEFGCGLEGVLVDRRADLLGIINGIDPDAWDPQQDPHIAARYCAKELSGKSLCKLALQQRQRLAERHDLLLGMIQRLAEQKGIDIFAQALPELMQLPIQLVLLGTGEPKYHEILQALADRFPERLALNLTFDNALAHQIEAGADAFLMPSRFEPCGLNQMYSMRFGTVPIVRLVGGLADTVVDLTPETSAAGAATGFVFEEYTASALVSAVQRAMAAYRDHALWARLVQAGMRQDFSWDRSAREYVTVYERALMKGRLAGAAR